MRKVKLICYAEISEHTFSHVLGERGT